MNKTQTFTVPIDVISRHIDQEAILVNLDTDQIFSLNSTGAHFWELLAAGNSLEEARTVMLDHYEVAPDQLDQEIGGMVRQLLDEGFLVARSS